MHVPGEDEVERTGRQKVEHVREVAEEDAQLGGLVDELPRTRRPLPVSARIDADELHAMPAKLDRLAFVDEQACRGEIVEARSARERIAAVLDVVIAEHDEGPAKTLDDLAERRLATRSRDEVPRDHDELGAS